MLTRITGQRRRRQRVAAIALAVMAAALPAHATTKGLNQIITPDIQPAGVLSVSFQAQSAVIGNPREIQLELGITPSFEVALFRGLSPGQTLGGVEYGLVQKPHWLLSTGFLVPGTGRQVQPFVEVGYRHGKEYLIAGAIRQGSDTNALLGWAHRVNERLQLAADYQGGRDNFATVGFTYNFSPTLSLNPAIYVSNRAPHHGYGYAVLSWNVAAGAKGQG